MKTSCIHHPESSRYIQLHRWQVYFCQDDHCAALLLSFFSAWHDWKIQNDHYYRRFNDIAEAHGDGRPHNENAYLFFTMEDLVNALMGLFGKKSISEGLTLLMSLGVITVHKNPNPRYCFDKTKYFKFYPEVCNKWLQENYSLNKNSKSDTQLVDNFDNAKIDDRSRKNARPSSENEQPSRKNGQAITDTTINTTNKNQSTNLQDDFLKTKKLSAVEQKEDDTDIKPILDALAEKGFSAERFQYPDVLDEVQRLQQAGANVEDFIEAYEKTKRSKGAKPFAARYLIKVVESILNNKQKPIHSGNYSSNQKEENLQSVYKNDFNNGLDWMGDLLEGDEK